MLGTTRGKGGKDGWNGVLDDEEVGYKGVLDLYHATKHLFEFPSSLVDGKNDDLNSWDGRLSTTFYQSEKGDFMESTLRELHST